jgi:ribosomal protein S18 acetylase RimI-like enzyme
MTMTRIRSATADDIDPILHLDHQWEQEAIAQVFIPLGRDAFLAQLAQFPAYFFVAEDTGAIIGYINGSVHTGQDDFIIPATEPYVEIENIYVAPAFRHHRVGGQLLEQLLDAAAQYGIQRFLVSTTSKEMDKMLTFYQARGFRLWYAQLVK